MASDVKNTGPLKGLRIFDMTRILAGPGATQILGDMGADVLKIERPGIGDDTRGWGPPYLKDAQGHETSESAYYLSANRNKSSITLDITKPEGAALAKKIIASCDVLVENFKTGGLEKYGLSYAQLRAENPRLIYCSLTGFGQTGPYAQRAGYDYLIQGMGGIMSVTGPVDGEPYKMGVAFADVMSGLYALNGILAALYHREKTGEGQHIDLALLDTQVAVMYNVAQSYLTSGNMPKRMGNGHASIVPYETFKAADGFLVLAVGNDRQFADFCAVAGAPEWAQDLRFAKNRDRVINRDVLVPQIAALIATRGMKDWIDALEARDVPCGPVNTLDKVFTDPQVQARGMTVDMKHDLAEKPVTLVANPIKFSATPVSYRQAPPQLGRDTADVLKKFGLNDDEIKKLQQQGVV